MKPQRIVFASLVITVATLASVARAPADGNGPNMFAFANPTGVIRTYDVKGAIDFDNLFFQALGRNGRSCGSCHQPADGWTITPAHVQARFDATGVEMIRFFARTTGRTHRLPMSRRSRRSDPRTACCSRKG
jgi:hypothetical protein